MGCTDCSSLQRTGYNFHLVNYTNFHLLRPSALESWLLNSLWVSLSFTYWSLRSRWPEAKMPKAPPSRIEFQLGRSRRSPCAGVAGCSLELELGSATLTSDIEPQLGRSRRLPCAGMVGCVFEVELCSFPPAARPAGNGLVVGYAGVYWPVRFRIVIRIRHHSPEIRSPPTPSFLSDGGTFPLVSSPTPSAGWRSKLPCKPTWLASDRASAERQEALSSSVSQAVWVNRPSISKACMTYLSFDRGPSGLCLAAHLGVPVHVSFHDVAQFLGYFVAPLSGCRSTQT